MTDFEQPELVEVNHILEMKYDGWGHPYGFDVVGTKITLRYSDYVWRDEFIGENVPKSIERLIKAQLECMNNE